MITNWRPEGTVGDVPSSAEDQEVCKRRAGRLRFRGEDAEDGGVDMVLVNATDMGELLHCILVWDVAAASVSGTALAAQYVIYSLSVPSDDIEGRVLLFAREKLWIEPGAAERPSSIRSTIEHRTRSCFYPSISRRSPYTV